VKFSHTHKTRIAGVGWHHDRIAVRPDGVSQMQVSRLLRATFAKLRERVGETATA
jgi:hypothetical protein